MPNETQVIFCTTISTILCFLAILLFSLSWSVLEPLEMGLKFNNFGKTIQSDKVYDGGRYFLGLGRSFIKYPRRSIIIDFSSDADAGGPALNAGTLDGQAVVLEVSLYYTLIFEQLPQLYNVFEDKPEEKLIPIAQSALKNAAVRFRTTEYFSNRTEIADRMFADVEKEFAKHQAKVQLLQLRGIGLPPGFESRLVANVVAEQEKTKATFDKEVAIVNAQTQVIEAQAQGQITELLGQAKADSLRIREKGIADGTRLLVGVESEVYRNLTQELGFTKDQLQQYIFLTSKLASATAQDQFLVGLGNDARLNLGSPARVASN